VPYRKNAKEDPVEIARSFSTQEMAEALDDFAKKKHGLEIPESFVCTNVTWKPADFPGSLVAVYWRKRKET